jgi:hypothetical protein
MLCVAIEDLLRIAIITYKMLSVQKRIVYEFFFTALKSY